MECICNSLNQSQQLGTVTLAAVRFQYSGGKSFTVSSMPKTLNGQSGPARHGRYIALR